LSLDNIKVVRNDLSDADIEVVTRKMAPEKSVKPAVELAAPARLADRNVGARVPAMFSAVNP
jgi:hypothetical protein